jgi:hypothetical protein
MQRQKSSDKNFFNLYKRQSCSDTITSDLYKRHTYSDTNLFKLNKRQSCSDTIKSDLYKRHTYSDSRGSPPVLVGLILSERERRSMDARGLAVTSTDQRVVFDMHDKGDTRAYLAERHVQRRRGVAAHRAWPGRPAPQVPSLRPPLPRPLDHMRATQHATCYMPHAWEPLPSGGLRATHCRGFRKQGPIFLSDFFKQQLFFSL